MKGVIIMSNLEKYNAAFIEAFGCEEGILEELKYQSIDEWDSVGHMTLVGELEDAFDIEMETDDIVDFSDYKKGIMILEKYGVEI